MSKTANYFLTLLAVLTVVALVGWGMNRLLSKETDREAAAFGDWQQSR